MGGVGGAGSGGSKERVARMTDDGRVENIIYDVRGTALLDLRTRAESQLHSLIPLGR